MKLLLECLFLIGIPPTGYCMGYRHGERDVFT